MEWEKLFALNILWWKYLWNANSTFFASMYGLWSYLQVVKVLKCCHPKSLLGWIIYIFFCIIFTPGIVSWLYFNINYSAPDLSDDNEKDDDNRSEIDKIFDSFYKKR